ncbi:MAG: hypothetical protein IKC11_05005 [Clostridia bacterium]|nr:hypothetical protein [Clostridia bacterium]
MNDNISPIRKKYDLFLLIFMGLVLFGAIPFGACDKLEGGFLVYFIVYIALTVGTIITISALFPYVRKKEIEFFKNKFNIENMNKSISFDFKENDYIFCCDRSTGNLTYVDVELTPKGLKDLLYKEEYLYSSFKIYATYQCGFVGEIYKVIIIFENDNQYYSIKLDNTLYSLIKYYNLNVDNLDNVLSECETNLKTFFKSKKLKKEAIERNKTEYFNNIVSDILKLLKEKADYSNYELTIKYHKDFIIKYNIKKQEMYINEKYYCIVEHQDIQDFIEEITSDMYYFVEYRTKRLSITPYFKLINKKKTNIDKIKKSNKILRIFDINSLIYNKKQTN